jgi:hypothetical protein
MTMPLEVTTRQDGDVGILQISGYICDPEAERITEAGKALFEGGTRRILTGQGRFF